MRRGFTLIELVLAVGLSTLVLMAMASLMAPLARGHVRSIRQQTAQSAAAAAFLWVDRRLREASWIGSPSRSAVPTSALEGCANALRAGTGLFSPLDASRPMTWFAMCEHQGGLALHGGDGCPPRYRCGEGAEDLRAGPKGAMTARFSRASEGAADVVAELSATSDGETTTLRTAGSVGPAGEGAP